MLYDARIRVPGLEDRRFSAEQWWDVTLPLAAGARGFRVEQAGVSAEGRPLRHVSWGEGDTRVLLWSQMHGDESTASMAIADLFRFLGEHPEHPLVQRLRTGTSLHFLPVMNPDGAARFQRRNAQGIGAQGLGGLSTVLDVKILDAPCHAAGKPVASATELQRFMVEDAIGQPVEITVLRNGALVDVIATCDDAFLVEHRLPKGLMQLLDADSADRLYAAMGNAREMLIVAALGLV